MEVKMDNTNTRLKTIVLPACRLNFPLTTLLTYLFNFLF